MRTIPIFLVLGLILSGTFVSGQGQYVKTWEVYVPSHSASQGSYGAEFQPALGQKLKHLRTPDGGFVVLGNRLQSDKDLHSQIFVFKINSEGETLWEYLHDDPESVMEDAYDLAMDMNGHILVACKRTTNFLTGPNFIAESSDYMVLKLSPSGQFLWQTIIPGEDNKVSRAQAIVCDSFGNSYTAGALEEDFTFDQGTAYINKLDSAGNIVWELEIPDKRIGNLRLQHNTLELALFKKGSTFLRFDLDGTIIDYGNPIEGMAYSVQADHHGNVYTSGHFGTFRLSKQFPDFSHSFTYEKTTLLPSPGLANEVKYYIISEDSSVCMTGRFYGKNVSDSTKNTLCDMLTVKLDANGNILWEDLYKNDFKRTCQIGNHIAVDEQGVSFVTGYQSATQNGNILASHDMVIMLYDPDGKRIDSIYHNGPANKRDDGIYSIPDGDDLTLFGWSQNENDLYDHAIIKYSKKTTATPPIENLHPYLIFPNPGAADHLTIQCPYSEQIIYIFNIHGQFIHQIQAGPGVHEIYFPTLLAPGMYLIVIGSKHGQATYKYVVH